MESFADCLLAYYDLKKRDLPWRRDSSPYQVWVSEIMLQQTRIETVIPYYLAFLNLFPDVRSLAEASEDEVLKAWEGLGYYSRAKNLRKGAQYLVEHFDGELPKEKKELLKVPGIGEYTSSSIASIAFGEPEIALDGNLFRIYARVNALKISYEETKTRKDALSFFKQNLSLSRPGDFNEALMELGETVCLPNGSPICKECPLQSLCLAHQKGLETSFPLPRKKKERESVSLNVFLLCCKGSVLIRKRENKGLLAHAYEFPNCPSEVSPSSFLKGIGIHEEPISLGQGKHVFSHLVWKMNWYRAELDKLSQVERMIWVRNADLKSVYMLPKAFTNFCKKAAILGF